MNPILFNTEFYFNLKLKYKKINKCFEFYFMVEFAFLSYHYFSKLSQLSNFLLLNDAYFVVV